MIEQGKITNKKPQFLSSLVLNSIKKMFLINLLLAACCLLPNHVSAQNEFSARISPVIELPRLSQFNIGIGASALIDWSFLSFYKFKAGVSAGVGFLNMPVKAGDAFSFIDIMGGAFISFRPLDRLAVRAGFNTGIYQFEMEDNSYTKAFFSPSVGVEVFISPYFSAYAEGRYTHRVFTQSAPFSSFGASVGVRVNITEFLSNRPRIQIEKTNQFNVFPVSWAWYEENPVAHVKVTNEETNTIRNINLSFFMESYMGQPFTFAAIPKLLPGDSAEVDVTALFNEVMLGLTENINANGEILVQYRSLGSGKQASIPVQMPVFSRNTLSWDDDRRAAAFVSPRDSAARLFSRYVASAINLYIESGRASSLLLSYPKNVLFAASLFETLRIYGISYVVDPSMSFVNMKSDTTALDILTYPYECLYYRGGDCGHLSVLFCSLLESLGIETAFITVPGHIYIAFDIGDDSWRRDDPNIIEMETETGRLRRWLPVEITVPGEGFNRAWRIGARQWINQREDAVLFPLKECWEIYPSVTVSASVDYPPEMPPVDDIISAVEAELRR